MRTLIDIDYVHSRAIVREIGERLRTSLKAEPELPASFKMQINRLREFEEQSPRSAMPSPVLARPFNVQLTIVPGLVPRVGAVKRILKVLTYIAAGLYLLVDAIFMMLAKPIADWIAEHVALRRLRDWIKSLPPYPSLALFFVPVIVLEPIKPIAAYLAATGQFLSGAVTFIIGELLKLVLVERLFNLTREKLMRIPTFARLYEMYSQAIAWLKETEAWRTVQSLVKNARDFFRPIGARATHWMRRRNRQTGLHLYRKDGFPDH